MSAAMRNFAQGNAWQTISHCGIKLAIYQSGVSLLYPSDSCTYCSSHSIAFTPPYTVTRSSQASCINRYVLFPVQGPWVFSIYDETSRWWTNCDIQKQHIRVSSRVISLSSRNDRQERRPMWSKRVVIMNNASPTDPATFSGLDDGLSMWTN